MERERCSRDEPSCATQELSLCKLLLVFFIERCDLVVHAAWESLINLIYLDQYVSD